MENEPVVQPKQINAVFEGGGVKGSALVGALAETEARGYSCMYVAGTSAGAIIASLVAAGYRATELAPIMAELDYLQFKDKTVLSSIPLVGQGLSIGFHKGIHRGKVFEDWLRGLLNAKGVHTFGDLVYAGVPEQSIYRYVLQVVVSDITRGRLAVFPRDAALYDINPHQLDVARAVRMSMSIPYFYTPAVVPTSTGDVYAVDGGVLSNFPVWMFDGKDNTTPLYPTIGYKLVDPDEGKPRVITGPVTLLSALFNTMMEAHDARYIEDSNFMRTVPIPTLGIQTTDFNLSPESKHALFESGRGAAGKFFDDWDHEKYQAALMKKEEHRTERLKEGMEHS